MWLLGVWSAYELLLSPFIVHEVAHILRERFSWDESLVRRQVKLLAKTGTLITPTSIPRAIEADPDDNLILACAITGKADLIVSGDRHLRKLKTYEGVAILRPVDFLRSLPAV